MVYFRSNHFDFFHWSNRTITRDKTERIESKTLWDWFPYKSKVVSTLMNPKE